MQKIGTTTMRNLATTMTDLFLNGFSLYLYQYITPETINKKIKNGMINPQKIAPIIKSSSFI